MDSNRKNANVGTYWNTTNNKVPNARSPSLETSQQEYLLKIQNDGEYEIVWT